jgi:hypothetical protein
MYIACPFGLKVTNHPRTEQNFLSCYSYSHPKRIVTIEARARNWCYTKFENGATCPSTVVVQSITKTVGRSMAVKNQPAHGSFCKGAVRMIGRSCCCPILPCCLLWPYLVMPEAWTITLFVPHSKYSYATLGADVMRTPSSRARQTRCPSTTAIRAQPVTNSVMSGRVFLKQVPDLSSLYEAAAAEAQDAEAVLSTNQHGWIEKNAAQHARRWR